MLKEKFTNEAKTSCGQQKKTEGLVRKKQNDVNVYSTCDGYTGKWPGARDT